MNNWRNYVIIILIIILGLYGMKMYNKCSRLERENIELKLGQDVVRDIIEEENKLLQSNILSLEDQVIYYRYQIDSLKKVKQKVIIKTEYIISEDIIEGVALLKENLKCERY